MEGRIPPYSQEAEQALLGAGLLDKEAVETALEHIRPEDFYREEHRIIFACQRALVLRGEPCDLVTVSAELNKNGQMERAGGIAYLASLANIVPATSSAAYYAKIIAEKSLIRALIKAGAKISEEGLNGTVSGDELIEIAEKAIMEVTEGRTKEGLYDIKELIDDVLEQIEHIKSISGTTGVPTFRDLDKYYLSGLQKGDLIILAARPAMGKTSMAINIAQEAAIRHGKTVAVFSLEMPKEQLVQRMLCTQARVDQGRIRKGDADEEYMNKLAEAMIPFSTAELYIDDTATITVNEIRAKCRKLKMEKKKLDLVVIDYLQLITGSSRRSENRQQEISEISRSLKALAKELDVPVLALSQLSRASEKNDEEPNLSHLRESGAIEQDADIVIFLHRKKDSTEEAGIINVIIAKHRNGAVGKVKMVFIPQYTKFEDMVSEFVTPPGE
ncbi:MAG: replicative DNA helicase [Firmicutes bacterium]|nr:replicative DNA helicase [Bacillota bacterium]